jgi:hypothetical protein
MLQLLLLHHSLTVITLLHTSFFWLINNNVSTAKVIQHQQKITVHLRTVSSYKDVDEGCLIISEGTSTIPAFAYNEMENNELETQWAVGSLMFFKSLVSKLWWKHMLH